MFKVKDTESGEVFTVYAISGTMFLIYDRADNGGTWAYGTI